ncbi:MAG: hypothetical protein N2255_02635 [Kiritimatiellae bacterium]|nr:hypothetical protein [Kiritimatiellia bacterium]
MMPSQKIFSTTLVVNIPEETQERIEKLMKMTGKPKSDVARWVLDVGLDVIFRAIEEGEINPKTGLPMAEIRIRGSLGR